MALGSGVRQTLFASAALLFTGFTLSSCGSSDAIDVSGLKVTNGQVIEAGEYPSVVLLYDKDAGSICTGTFVSETVVLTAAHCTMSGDVDADGNVDLTLRIIELEIDADGEKKASLVAESQQVIRNPDWDRAGRNVNRYDLGVVIFEEGVASAISEISPVPARVGDDFTIVGFGLNSSDQNDSESAGIKRKGNNRVTQISGGFIQFLGKNSTTDGSGTDVAAGSGDSGGPLFIDGRVAGVTSGGGWGGFGRTRSLYVDLHAASSKAFLSDFIEY